MRGAHVAGTVIVAVVLFLLAAWLGFLVQEVPREIGKGLGVALTIFGIFNLLFYRRHTRIFFDLGSKKAHGLLAVLGTPGLHFLFLGIGFVLIGSGIVFWLRGT
jgi:hypothetical protein